MHLPYARHMRLRFVLLVTSSFPAELQGQFYFSSRRATTVQITVTNQCGAHYDECAAAPSVEIPCEPISSALMATMARTLRHSPEPLRTCPTLAFMAYSLASWDAAMARSNYSDTEKFNFKVSSSELSNTMTIMFGKFFTLYFDVIPRSKFFNPTCRRLFFSSSSSSLLCSRRTASRAWWRYQPE